MEKIAAAFAASKSAPADTRAEQCKNAYINRDGCRQVSVTVDRAMTIMQHLKRFQDFDAKTYNSLCRKPAAGKTLEFAVDMINDSVQTYTIETSVKRTLT